MRLCGLLRPFVIILIIVLPLGRLVAKGEATLPGREGRSVVIAADGGTLVLTPLLDNAIRVQFQRGESAGLQSLVLREGLPRPEYRVRHTDGSVSVILKGMSAVYDKRTDVVSFYNSKGRNILNELPGSRRLTRSSLQGQPTWVADQSFDSPPNEHLYGCGEFQDGYLNIRGLPRRLTQVNSQIAIPVVVSSRGFELLWHNYGLTEFDPANRQIALRAGTDGGERTAVDATTTQGTHRLELRSGAFAGEFQVGEAGRYAFFLDVGAKMAHRWHVEIDGRPAVDFSNIWLPPTTSWISELSAGRHQVRVVADQGDVPALSFRRVGDSTEFRSPVAAGIDYVVIAGEGDQLTSSYRRLTGEVPLPPVWALGYIHSRERYKSQAELLENAKGFRDRGIPLDVIVQDWQYWGRYGWNDMRFDEAEYPDPAAMVAKLHAEHVRLMVSVWSRIDPQSDLGREFAARKYFIPGTQWVDFFNPAAASFYWGKVRDRLLRYGIDAWWFDATEPENDDLAGRMTHVGWGGTVRDLYPLFVTRTVYQGLRHDAPGRRPFILTRSAFIGEQRYGAAVWSGDIGANWASLRRQITAGLGYVVTGLPWWTTDTGGFFRPGESQYTDPAYRELFLRWFQYSVFTPLLRVHGYQSDTELWRYGPYLEAQCRRWLALRYKLLPYLYSEAARVSFSGSTLMRPLVLDFPGDEKALSQPFEYMFGPALLVAPVTSPGIVEKKVYLPRSAGGWYDFWSGRRSRGGSEVSVQTPMEQIPLFVRAGSILPLGPALDYATESSAEPIELRVYAGADGAYSIYEDDGTDFGYEKGERSSIPIRWDEARQALTFGAREGCFPGMPRKQTFRVVWVSADHGSGDLKTRDVDAVVTYDGSAVTIVRPNGRDPSSYEGTENMEGAGD